MQCKALHILDGLAATVSSLSTNSAMPTREEFEMRLDALQGELAKLSADEDVDVDYLGFQAHAEVILSSATQDDAACVRTRTDGMLAGAGLIPTDDAGHCCA
ncbi:hypothetical protein EYC55_08555 [Xanthomonas oryzae]|nr:hypothetical protein [Xanthomonas oryzae]QBG95527.1 hypothetical protein EYC55_08555 [Xanthomonas oryzae]